MGRILDAQWGPTIGEQRLARSYDEYVKDKKRRREKPQSKQEWERGQFYKEKAERERNQSPADKEKAKAKRQEKGIKSIDIVIRQSKGEMADAAKAMKKHIEKGMDPEKAAKQVMRDGKATSGIAVALGKRMRSLMKMG